MGNLAVSCDSLQHQDKTVCRLWGSLKVVGLSFDLETILKMGVGYEDPSHWRGPLSGYATSILTAGERETGGLILHPRGPTVGRGNVTAALYLPPSFSFVMPAVGCRNDWA